jgi:hypothetical protein
VRRGGVGAYTVVEVGGGPGRRRRTSGTGGHGTRRGEVRAHMGSSRWFRKWVRAGEGTCGVARAVMGSGACAGNGSGLGRACGVTRHGRPRRRRWSGRHARGTGSGQDKYWRRPRQGRVRSGVGVLEVGAGIRSGRAWGTRSGGAGTRGDIARAQAGAEWVARDIRSGGGVLKVGVRGGLLRFEGSRRVSPVSSETRRF